MKLFRQIHFPTLRQTYLLLAAVVLLQQFLFLIQFGWVYTDSDQTIMWYGLKAFAQGHFEEPRFLGQDYNTMLEALLAVPFYRLGIPAHIILPLITSALALFPFFWFSSIMYKKGKLIRAAVIVSIPLLLPTDYHLISLLSRGFVTGIFASSIGVGLLMKGASKRAFFLSGFFMAIGFSLNPNSLVLTLPVLLYYFTIHYKQVTFYILGITGIVIGLIPHFLAERFYTLHPSYVLHSMQLELSVDYLKDAIVHLDDFFNPMAPVFWKQGFIVPVAFLGIGIYFIAKKQWSKGIYSIGSFLFLCATLFLSKVNDGTNSVFFSFSRMYLALPVLIGFSTTLFNFSLAPRILRIQFIFLIPVVFLTGKMLFIQTSIQHAVHKNREHVVGVATVDHVKTTCQTVQSIAQHYNVDLVVIVNSFDYDFINYGCEVCEDENQFPLTLRPSYERRTMRLTNAMQHVYSNVFFIDNQHKLDAFTDSAVSVERIPQDSTFYLVRDNVVKTQELFNKLHIDTRPL